jgi:hypothetical protein
MDSFIHFQASSASDECLQLVATLYFLHEGISNPKPDVNNIQLLN